MFFRLDFPWQWAHSSLQLFIQPCICAPGTQYCWMDRGSVEYEVCPTLLHMASTGDQTPDLLILSPTPYPLGHMLSHPIPLMMLLWQHAWSNIHHLNNIAPESHLILVGIPIDGVLIRITAACVCTRAALQASFPFGSQLIVFKHHLLGVPAPATTCIT